MHILPKLQRKVLDGYFTPLSQTTSSPVHPLVTAKKGIGWLFCSQLHPLPPPLSVMKKEKTVASLKTTMMMTMTKMISTDILGFCNIFFP